MQPLVGVDPRAGLLEADVTEALSLARGATVRHGVDVLDSAGVFTEETLPFEASGSAVTWRYRAPDRVAGQSDAVAAVRRSAVLAVSPDADVNLAAARLRLWTEWRLATGDWARFYLGVFLVTNPGALVHDGVRRTRTLQLASKAYLWANTTLVEPEHLPAGTGVVEWVKDDLTSRFGETRFAIPTSTATLTEARTFEAGTSWLEVYSRLFEAIGFDQLTDDEQGQPSTRPLAELATLAPEHTYGAGRGKIRTAGQVEPLLPTIPNVVRFVARQGPSLGNVEGNGLRTVKNQSTGPASIDARGGIEIEQRIEVDADSQPVLDEIAAADAQRYFAGGGLTFSGHVALNPRHSDRDVIALLLPKLDLNDEEAWAVTQWTYPLADLTDEQGALMPITAERRVAL